MMMNRDDTAVVSGEWWVVPSGRHKAECCHFFFSTSVDSTPLHTIAHHCTPLHHCTLLYTITPLHHTITNHITASLHLKNLCSNSQVQRTAKCRTQIYNLPTREIIQSLIDGSQIKLSKAWKMAARWNYPKLDRLPPDKIIQSLIDGRQIKPKGRPISQENCPP